MTETSWGREEEEDRLLWEDFVLTPSGEEEIEKSLFCFTSTVAVESESESRDINRKLSLGFIEAARSPIQGWRKHYRVRTEQ